MPSADSSEHVPRYTIAEIKSRPEFRDVDWLTRNWGLGFGTTKRMLDIAVGLVLLLFFVITFPFVAIGIKLDSRGPIFYVQERVGVGGTRFRVLKYRSMIQDAERNGARFASQDDSRITEFGAKLRVSRIDELPQAINVLLGQMSTVGPRPERPHVVDAMSQVAPVFSMRTIVRPGLTGYAQVHAHYAATEAELLTKLEYDLYYIRHASMRMDLGIMVRTVTVVLRRQGT